MHKRIHRGGGEDAEKKLLIEEYSDLSLRNFYADAKSLIQITTKRTKDSEIITFQLLNFVLFVTSFVVKYLFRF